jgi:hypothetical protein
MNFPKYKKNLSKDGDKVYSYNTHVATISRDKLIVHGYWSVTTSKHVNYVANYYGLTKIDGPRDDVEKNPLNAVFTGIKWFNILADMSNANEHEKNESKKRIIKAGLGDAITFPDDWDSLSEDEKSRRLNGAINCL